MSFSHHTSFPCHFLMALISSLSFLDCGREMSVPIVRTDAEILLDHLFHKQYCKKPSPQFLMYLENTLNSQELGKAWIKLVCSKNCNTWKKDNLSYSGQFSQSLVQNISSQTIGIDCSPCCNVQKKSRQAWAVTFCTWLYKSSTAASSCGHTRHSPAQQQLSGTYPLLRCSQTVPEPLSSKLAKVCLYWISTHSSACISSVGLIYVTPKQ